MNFFSVYLQLFASLILKTKDNIIKVQYFNFILLKENVNGFVCFVVNKVQGDMKKDKSMHAKCVHAFTVLLLSPRYLTIAACSLCTFDLQVSRLQSRIACSHCLQSMQF